MGMPAERELEFATGKIRLNLSNYSAWHFRSKMLALLHGQPGAEPGAPAAAAAEATGISRTPALLLPMSVLEGEFELVSQALFTEPEDQSGWIYHRWLLGALRFWLWEGGNRPEGRGAVPGADRTAAEPCLPVRRHAVHPHCSPGGESSRVLAYGAPEPCTARRVLGHGAPLVALLRVQGPSTSNTHLQHPKHLPSRPIPIHDIRTDCCMARWQSTRGTDAETSARRQLDEALEGQLGLVQGLLELEPEAVWPRKQRAHMLGLRARAEAGEAAGSETAKAARAAWRELEALDPARSAYYRYMCAAA